MTDPKAKSAVTPIKTVRNYALGIHRIEQRIRKLLHRHGADDDTAGLVYPLTDQYLRLGREVRDMALFDLKVRRELAEVQDAELRIMSNEEMRKVLEGMNRRAGFRKVSTVKAAARDRLAAAGLDPTLVDSLIPDVPEHEPRMSATALMRQADRRIDHDLDAARADIDEALSASEGVPVGDDGETGGPETSTHSEDGKGT